MQDAYDGCTVRIKPGEIATNKDWKQELEAAGFEITARIGEQVYIRFNAGVNLEDLRQRWKYLQFD